MWSRANRERTLVSASKEGGASGPHRAIRNYRALSCSNSHAVSRGCRRRRWSIRCSGVGQKGEWEGAMSEDAAQDLTNTHDVQGEPRSRPESAASMAARDRAPTAAARPVRANRRRLAASSATAEAAAAGRPRRRNRLRVARAAAAHARNPSIACTRCEIEGRDTHIRRETIATVLTSPCSSSSARKRSHSRCESYDKTGAHAHAHVTRALPSEHIRMIPPTPVQRHAAI